MSLSIVIPTYTINSDLRDMTLRCVKSYAPYADELIICEDGGEFDVTFMAWADSYLYNKKNLGFTKNVNRGWRYATGDYVAIVSSDTYLLEGDFKQLCVEGKVTSPLIDNQGIGGLAGCCFVVHKDCPKYLVETMRTYYSDEEYAQRVAPFFTKVESVKIYHHQAQTVMAAGIAGKVDEDKEAYENLSK